MPRGDDDKNKEKQMKCILKLRAHKGNCEAAGDVGTFRSLGSLFFLRSLALVWTSEATLLPQT